MASEDEARAGVTVTAKKRSAAIGATIRTGKPPLARFCPPSCDYYSHTLRRIAMVKMQFVCHAKTGKQDREAADGAEMGSGSRSGDRRSGLFLEDLEALTGLPFL